MSTFITKPHAQHPGHMSEPYFCSLTVALDEPWVHTAASRIALIEERLNYVGFIVDKSPGSESYALAHDQCSPLPGDQTKPNNDEAEIALALFVPLALAAMFSIDESDNGPDDWNFEMHWSWSSTYDEDGKTDGRGIDITLKCEW